MGVTWKGSDVVSIDWNTTDLSGSCLGGFAPGSAFGLQTYFGFTFYFTYASAFGRCPAPGEGNPD